MKYYIKCLCFKKALSLSTFPNSKKNHPNFTLFFSSVLDSNRFNHFFSMCLITTLLSTGGIVPHSAFEPQIASTPRD